MTQNKFPAWIQDAIIYQIFPDRFANGNPANDSPRVVPWDAEPTRNNFFGGDLQGIIEQTDYLQELGVNCLYLTPIFKSPSNHRYDTECYFTVDPMLGTETTLKQLTQDLHARDMRIILDGVFAHVSDKFAPFRDVEKLEQDSDYVSWFLMDDFPLVKYPHPSYRACGGLASMPRLNSHNGEVQKFMAKVGKYWIEKVGIDGWRLDMAWEVPHTVWEKFKSSVRDANPEAFVLGEFWGDASPWLSPQEIDSATNYLWRDIVFRFFVNQSIDAPTFVRELTTLRKHYGPNSSTMVNLLGSHDTPRLMNHCKGSANMAVQALAFLLVAEGIPLIYYGDEVGLTGWNDPECRKSMPWSQEKWNMQIYDAVKTLANLRKQHIALRRGNVKFLQAFDRILVFSRSYEDDTVLVVFNAGFQHENVTVDLSQDLTTKRKFWRSSSEISITDNGKSLSVTLPAQGVLLVYANKKDDV